MGGLTDEFQALAEQGPDAFDADPSNGEYNPETGQVEAPQEAAQSLAEDTARQGAVPDWLPQSGQGQSGGSGPLGGNQTVLLVAAAGVAAIYYITEVR